MKFNKRLHFSLWVVYFIALFLYLKIDFKAALIVAYILMAGIILQILKWAINIPNKEK